MIYLASDACIPVSISYVSGSWYGSCSRLSSVFPRILSHTLRHYTIKHRFSLPDVPAGLSSVPFHFFNSRFRNNQRQGMHCYYNGSLFLSPAIYTVRRRALRPTGFSNPAAIYKLKEVVKDSVNARVPVVLCNPIKKAFTKNQPHDLCLLYYQVTVPQVCFS